MFILMQIKKKLFLFYFIINNAEDCVAFAGGARCFLTDEFNLNSIYVLTNVFLCSDTLRTMACCRS